MKSILRYQQSRQLTPCIATPPLAGLQLICVIPCMDEPSMLATLLHLQQCTMPAEPIEVIVVVNHSSLADDACRRCNEQTAQALASQPWPDACRCHVMTLFDLPAKQFGVGVARKAGMDEAMLRLAAVQAADGLIVCLDADCRVDDHYFTALRATAIAQPKQHAMLCDFHHPWEALQDDEHRRAIQSYELLLRTIALGWAYAGLPYAFTAIGSCMVVRANAYARHQGMNTRQAGEDFYFMHKLAREREIIVLHDVCVYPSPRTSTRTPFGTGQAVRQLQEGNSEHQMMAAAQVFEVLRCMSASLDTLFEAQELDAWLALQDVCLADFLLTQGIAQAVPRLLANAAQPSTFRKHYFTWFDGLKAWRFVHHYRQQHSLPVLLVAQQLLAMVDNHQSMPHEQRAIQSLIHAL